MPRMIVSIDGVVIKEVQVTKDRMTLGRRPYNDIVIDNLAVSGEHAAVLMSGKEVQIEDLGSTNGTYVNGQAVKKQQLHDGDNIEIGKYSIKFVDEAKSAGFDKTMIFKPGTAAPPAHAATQGPAGATIRVLSGSASGREMPLTKVVTTLGKPGVAVAAITKRHNGFVVTHVEGSGNPIVNGSAIGSEPVLLKSGDLIELAGTQMQFIQS